MSLPVASKMRSPSRPSIVTRAKSDRLVECLAAVNMASNCRWVNPRVGDSAGTCGRGRIGGGRIQLRNPCQPAGAVSSGSHLGR
jgi:hypothetical protein